MAVSKIVTASLNDNAVTNAKVGNDISVGKFINKITISNDATVSISSSVLTDEYDYYDVIIDSVKPVSDGRLLELRMGVEGTTGVDSGSNYAIIIQSYMTVQGIGVTNATYINANFSRIYLTAPYSTSDMGNTNADTCNLHLRFHNLRYANRRKAVTAINAHMSTRADYNAIYNELGFMGIFDNTSNKVDELEFRASSGNLLSGTISTYGIKL